MRVLITGANGFIGSEITKRLAQDDDFEVIGLVRISSNTNMFEPIKDAINNIDIRYGNFSDYASIKKIVKDSAPQCILHVGAQTSVRHSFELPLEFNEANYLGTINLIHAALEVPSFKKFIFASTMETYGWQPQKKPFTEDAKLNPASPYAASKVACESYIRMAQKAFGLPYLISRACNTYGRKHSTGFVTEYVASSMLKNKTVYLGTPNAVRDMMFVDDHVDAYIKMLKSNVANETFNFGTGSRTPMKEIAEKLKRLTGFKGKIVHSFPPNYPWRPVVEDFLSLNASKANEMLGWKPKFSLDSGLKKVVEYWKQKSSKHNLY